MSRGFVTFLSLVLGCAAQTVPSAPPAPGGTRDEPSNRPSTCSCGGTSCPATYEEAVRSLSASCGEAGFVLTRAIGCGKIEVASGSAFEGSQYFYRESDGSLLGAAFWFDVPISSCAAYPSGAVPEPCARAKPCTLCGQYEGVPPCEVTLSPSR